MDAVMDARSAKKKRPTIEQLIYFYERIKTGHITEASLQSFLEKCDLFSTTSPIFRAKVVFKQPAYKKLQTRFFMVKVTCDKGNFQPAFGDLMISRETRTIAFQYLQVHRETTTNAVLTEMRRERGLRPAMYEELLAFDEAFPEELTKHQIIALGSVFMDKDDGPVCPSVLLFKGNRMLTSCQVETKWPAGTVFLATKI